MGINCTAWNPMTNRFTWAMSQCDRFEDGQYVTTLTSPNYPYPYHPDTHMEWPIEIPDGEYVTVRVNEIDIEHPWDTLTIIHQPINSTSTTTIDIRSGNVTSLALPSGKATVIFCSDVMEEYNGFAMEFRSCPLNDSAARVLSDEGFMCASGLQSISSQARCDHIIDCHDFSDEIACGECNTAEYFKCDNADICLSLRYHCDGSYDCPRGGDEKGCGNTRCPLSYECGEMPITRYGPEEPSCRRDENHDWLPFSTNTTDGWTPDYQRRGARKTTIIYMKGTPVRTLTPYAFQGFDNLHTIDMRSNMISTLPIGVFDGLPRLWKLVLANNSLTVLEDGTFRFLHNLRLLYLQENRIHSLDDGCFRGLYNLFFIELSLNNLSGIRPGTFADIGGSLQRLILEENQLTSVNASLIEGLQQQFIMLVLIANPLSMIEPGTFADHPQLRDLRVMARPPSPLPLYPEIFDGLNSLEVLHVYDPRLCCLLPAGAECVNREPPHPLFTCRKTFLQNITIKVSIWILGLSALVGNVFVIISRMRTKNQTTVASVQSTLITNLAVSDFLMGVYMMILAVMDLYIGDSYFWEGRSEEWRRSNTCQIAGFISVLSSEASVFLITLISVDRFISIVFPFSLKRLGVGSARFFTGLTWAVALLLSSISIAFGYLNPDAYSLSDVCVGLPLIRKQVDLYASLDSYGQSQYGISEFAIVAGASVSTWQYSIALFLGVNLISFLIIALCYFAIFIKVRLSRAEVGRKAKSSEEIKLAIKMALIIGTDFCCWMPIIILGILVQADLVKASPDVYAWLVVFVMPINSSLNPYLYTIVDRASSKQKVTSK